MSTADNIVLVHTWHNITNMPWTNDASMPSTDPAASSGRLDDVTTGTTTPISSATTLSVTPAEIIFSEPASDATAQLRKELDQKLEAYVLADRRTPSPNLSAEKPSSEKIEALPEFECAFRFCGSVDEPENIPDTKDAFITAISAEVEVISGIQKGLISYQTAINSRKYHTFSTEFLIDENTAIIVTLDQLDQVTAHLNKVEKEVAAIEDGNEKVGEELLDGFRQGQPSVMRTRAILRHSHVFYKINFVLASDKTPTLH